MALTLTQKRNKANSIFTPIWVALQKVQARQLKENGVYKSLPTRRVNLPYEVDKLEAGFKVVADGANGYTAIAYINHNSKGYVRKQGFGTGKTTSWAIVTPVTIPEDPEGIPNSIKISKNKYFAF